MLEQCAVTVLVHAVQCWSACSTGCLPCSCENSLGLASRSTCWPEVGASSCMQGPCVALSACIVPVQDFADDVQGLFNSVGSVGSRAKSLVPAGAIGSLGAKLGSSVQGLQQSGSGAGVLP